MLTKRVNMQFRYMLWAVVLFTAAIALARCSVTGD